MDPEEWCLALEEDTMRRELEWLLSKEFPIFAVSLQNQLKSCLAFITRPRAIAAPPPTTNSFFGLPKPLPPPPPQEYDPLDELDDPTTIRLETPGKALEAKFSVESWTLREGKLVIRTQKYNKGAPFITAIYPGAPWKFTQLHNAHNFIMLALDEIEDLVLVEALTSSQVLRSIDKIEDYLKQALDQFILNKATTPKSPQSSEVFSPRLPEILNVQFEIVGCSWVTSVYVTQPPAQSKSKIVVSDELGIDGRQNQEIIEVIQSIKPSKKLETITNFISSMNQLCCELREKLVAFSVLENEVPTTLPALSSPSL